MHIFEIHWGIHRHQTWGEFEGGKSPKICRESQFVRQGN